MTKRRPSARMAAAGFLAMSVALGVGACGRDGADSGSQRAEGPASPSQARTVRVALFRFQPEQIQVPVGGTVTWHNDDAIDHTVTAGVPGQPRGDFDKNLANKGSSASVTFERAGTFKYYCDRHPEAMRGEITVTP